MKHFNIKIRLIVLIVMVSNNMHADDIAVKNADGVTISYNFINNDTELEVTSPSSYYSGSVRIPSSVNYDGKNYKVSRIGEKAFSYCSKLTSVTIPASVTSIGEKAFYKCELTKVIVPSLVAWCKMSFYDQSSNPLNYAHHIYCDENTEIKDLIIPEGVTQIKNYAFSGCYGLTSVTIPNSVTRIGDEAFRACTGLTSVTIPNSVTSIGKNAFRGCSRLTSVTIPNSVTSIEISTFYGCSKLNSVTIPNSVTSIGDSAFYNTYIKSLTIGTGVLTIGDKAFGYKTSSGEQYGKKPIKTIWLSNTPPSGYKAAEGYINYVSNDLYTSLSYTEIYPFLSSIFEVDGVKYVPVSPSERKCDALDCLYDESAEKVHINSSISYKGVNMTVRNINHYTCYNNEYIKDVQLTNNGYVGYYAFYKCSSITTVNASNKGGIGGQAFYDCDAITNINLSNQGSIGEQAFYGCNSLKTAIVNNIGLIDNDAFRQCNSLKTCNLGNQITRIYKSSFSGCSKLQQIVIPESVDSIGDYSFSYCSGMKSVVIGNRVKTIPQHAFSGCSSLKNLQIGDHVKQIDTYAFENCTALPLIEIPANVTSISDYVFSGCKSLATVLIANRDSELSLGTNGSDPLFYSCPLDTVYIGGNITFNKTANKGYSPFYRNTSLRSIHITDKETEISANEFYGCTNLKNVWIGDGVTTIGNRAFSGCSSLDYFAFGSNVKTIGTEAFSDCTAMTQLYSSAQKPPVCGSQALDDINKWNCTLHVPTGSVADYQTANQWKEFFFIDEIPTNINDVEVESLDTNKIVEIYDIQGIKLDYLQSGLNIVRMKDGTTKKMIVK